MEKTIAIVGGGDLHDCFLPQINQSSVIIGVDYGAYWLIARNVVPAVAIGDFDSVSKKELKDITKKVSNVIRYPVTKDATDMELAVEHAYTLSPTEIVLYGAVGTRLDHSLGNVLLLESKQKTGCIIRLKTATSEAVVVSGAIAIPKDQYQYVSVVSLSESAIVSLEGFVYSCDKKIFLRGQTVGLSNELQEKGGGITVHKGTILVIRSND